MKKINEKFIVFLIMGLLVNNHQLNAFPVMLVVGIIQFAWSAFEMVNTVHDTYGKFSGPSTGDLIEQSAKLADSVEKWGGRIEEKIEQTVTTLLTRLPLLGELTNDLRLLNTYISRIDELYADMWYYLKHPEEFSKRGLHEFIKSLLSRDGDDLRGSIAQMHSLIVPQGLARMKKSLFLLMAEETRDNELSLCGIGTSPQRRLVDLFDVAMESEMRAFVLLGFGYMADGYIRNITMKGGMKIALMKLTRRAKDYTIILKQTMTASTTRFRRCDPLYHEKGVTFLEFDRFLQGSVLSARVLFRAACRECDVSPKSVYLAELGCGGIGCNNKDPDTCLGHLVNCQSMRSRAAVCDYDSAKPIGRRYEWFVDGDGNLFGDNSIGCPKQVTYGSRFGSCDICRCICVEDSWRSETSNRFIITRDQVTDTYNNMVVIGLTFVMINRALHLKIMQGKLEPRGEIDGNSTSWIEPEDIQHIQGTFKDRRDRFILKSEGSNDKEMVEGKDFVALSWESKRIGLDSLTLPAGYLLTGVRFRNKGGVIILQIQGTSFDDITGLLDPDSSFWFEPDNMPYAKRKKARDEYKHKGFLNPARSMQTRIDSTPYMYIDLHWSSLEHDAGQTTIPLLDSIPAISDPPTPLIGAGLYHNAQREYGGFLTLVLEGLDKSPYLPVD